MESSPSDKVAIIEENQSIFDLNSLILLNKIGSGSYGKVYKVKNKIDKKIYAAKISKNMITSNSDNVYIDISREVNIISKLNHASVLKFIGYSPINFKRKPKPVIITEYASNGSLEDLIQLDRKSTDKILTDTNKIIIIYGIASAISFLHSHNIFHRDLKPGNILLNEYLFPKIADFGLSKVNHLNTESMTMKSMAGIVGTPKYIAPEILDGENYINASDVYSFGMIVYELITLENPFENCDIYTVFKQIGDGFCPEFKTQINESYKNLIERCLKKDPSLRPSFKEILNELTNNQGFLTNSVIKEDFLNYVKYVNNYKSSYDSSKVIDIGMFNKVLIKDSSNKNTKINEYINYASEIYSYKKLIKLDKESLNSVFEAENDPEKQFVIGQSLIEGRYNFPIDTQLGIKYLKLSIKEGCFKSMIYYIEMLIKGEIIPKNLKKAKKILDSKFQNHEAVKLLLYGKLYKKDNNYDEARICFEKSFQLVNIEAIYEYGKLFYSGKYLISNKEKAIKYYQNAIANNCLKAMFKYGKILMKDEDYEIKLKGINYIKNSADKGYPKANFYYSQIISKGKEIPFDEDDEKNYLIFAINNGNINAMSLCKKYHSDSKNIILLKKAMSRGKIEAFYHYGKILIDNQSDKKKAVNYIKIAASEKNGYLDAIIYYANMLNHGINIDMDKNEACKFYKKSIEKGHQYSIYSYGLMILECSELEIDKEKELKYIESEINKGNVCAMLIYAFILSHSNYFDQNNENIEKYNKMAIDLGNYKIFNKFIIELKTKEKKYDNEIKIYEKIAKDKRGNIDRESIEYIKKYAYKGLSMYQIKYAQILEFGLGVKPNKKEAIQFYKRASNKDYIAQLNYAYKLYYGEEIDMNKEEAALYFKKAAEKSYYAALVYSNMLIKGDGIEKNIDEAIKYSKDNHMIKCNFARILENDESFPFDKIEAKKILKEYAEYGKENFLNNFYELLNDNLFIDKEKAFNIYKLATEKGDADAMNKYGIILYYIIDEDKEGKKYIKMAADKGNADGMANFAYFTLRNWREYGMLDNIYYFKIAADNGNVFSMYYYAYLKEKYIDRIPDLDTSDIVKYFKLAADNGYKYAMTKYAINKQYGIYTNIDKIEAFKYLKKAIDLDDYSAYFNYAHMLYYGEGGVTNKEEAIKYYKMSIDFGDQNAINDFSLILCQENNIVDIKNSIKYIKLSADNGNTTAMLNYGNLLLLNILIVFQLKLK